MSTVDDGSTIAASVPPKSKGSRLRKPLAMPAGLRPKKSHYQLPVWKLIHVPKRVLIPPATPSVGSVRSFKQTPLSQVKLADVLDNKHLSPLSVKDFEGYLVFKEHSAENLYCLLWLNEYTKEWEEYQKDPSAVKVAPVANENTDPNAARAASHLPAYLSESLQRGLSVFFAPNAPLEINLSAATRSKVLVDAGNSGNPADFAEARTVIENSLAVSLAGHCKNVVANAGPRRLVFCFCLGLFLFLCGLVPPLVGILGNYVRGIRAIGLFFICFGGAVMAMALQRICGVIWLLGEDRQLTAWELAPPTVTSGSIVSMRCPSTPRSSVSWDEESSYEYDEKDASFRSANSSDPYPWEVYENDHKTTSAVDFAPSVAPSSRPASYTTKTPSDLVPDSPPVFGPITKVFAGEVAYEQWVKVIKSLLWGALLMVVVGGVLMAVPNRG